MAFEITDFNRSYVKQGEMRGLFNVARADEADAGLKFYAYQNETGSYVIQQVTTSGTLKIYKYYAQPSRPLKLDTDWTARASLTYVDYYALFNQG